MTCTRCRWYKNEKGINCTPFFGNPNVDIVLCGEATESETEIFTGDVGKKLDELLTYIPVERKDLAIINSMRCYLERNLTPTKAEMDACLIYTLRDLNNIDPKIAVALGRSAFYQLTGKDPDSFAAYRGKCIESDKIKRKVFVTYHPAACLYDPKKWDKLVEDFKSISKYLNKDAEIIKHYKYKVVNSVDIWNNIKQKLFDSEEIYIDVEATGLSPYKEKLTTIQISNGKEPIYVIEDIFKDIKDDLKILLETKNVVGQGFNFDTKFFKVHLNIFPNITFDTCLAEYILTGLKDNDLNSLVQKYTPESYGYWEDIHKDGGPHKTKNKDRLRQYGADDVGVLTIIKKKQLKQLVKYGFIDFYNNILIPCDKILTKMSLRGITYDLDTLYEIDEKYKIKAEKLLFKALTLPGIDECERFFKRQYNARSAEMVRWLLLDYYKLPVIKTTKPTKSKPEGGPSVGQKEFEKYAEEYNNEYCKQMEKYRSVCNIRNTFLSGAVKFLIGNEAHTTYSLHATETGRPNSKGPNLLNIPRLKEIKSIFVARPGYSFIYTDAAQLEVRITAVIYNEPKLINICNDPIKDMHCSITAQAFNKDYDYIYNGYKNGDVEITELRTAGKSLCFGIIYQMGPAKLAYQLGITKEKAIDFIDTFYNGFSDLRKNIDKTKKLIIKQGWLRNYFGFVRRWKNHTEEDHNAQREGVNFLVQSPAWNLIQLAMIDVDRQISPLELNNDAYIVKQIYDAIIVECRDEYISEVAPIVKSAISNSIKPFEGLNRVSLRSDVEVGKRLSELKKLEI